LLKITKIEGNNVNIKVYIRVKGEVSLKYGDEISFVGEYDEPDSARNDKGFDYKNYLKSLRNIWNNYNKRS
jgi:predicted membrane metal-binding protein